MAFEGLQGTLRDRWADLTAKIAESSAFNNVREQFEAQSPIVQKSVLFGGLSMAALLVLSFPLGYLSDASDHMNAFEENRALIQGLLRASRSAKEPAPLPPPTDGGILQSMVERLLQSKKLLPEQMGEIHAAAGEVTKLAPPGVQQTSLSAQIKQLNLTQIIDIANALENLGPGIKLMGLDLSPTAGQTHYYDLTARLVSFGLPTVTIAADEEKPAGKNKRPAPKARDAEEGEGE